MITLKIDTNNGTLSEETAIFIAISELLDSWKEQGIIKGYSDVEVMINSNGGETWEDTANTIKK